MFGTIAASRIMSRSWQNYVEIPTYLSQDPDIIMSGSRYNYIGILR